MIWNMTYYISFLQYTQTHKYSTSRNFGQKFSCIPRRTRMHAHTHTHKTTSPPVFLSFIRCVQELHSWINIPRKLCNEYTMCMHEHVQIDVKMNIYANYFVLLLILATKFCVTIWFQYRKIEGILEWTSPIQSIWCDESWKGMQLCKTRVKQFVLEYCSNAQL